jgi:hypothetical protein
MAGAAVREEFHGPVSHASLPFEQVGWDMFDIVGVNRYFRWWGDLAGVEALVAEARSISETTRGNLVALQADSFAAARRQARSALAKITRKNRNILAAKAS